MECDALSFGRKSPTSWWNMLPPRAQISAKHYSTFHTTVLFTITAIKPQITRKKTLEVLVQKLRSTFSYITTNLSVMNSVPFPISLSLICTVVEGCSCRIPLVGGGKLLSTTISPYLIFSITSIHANAADNTT